MWIKKSLFEILGLVFKGLWFTVVYDRCEHTDPVKNAMITDLDRFCWHQSRKDWHNEEDNGSAYIPIKDDLRFYNGLLAIGKIQHEKFVY